MNAHLRRCLIGSILCLAFPFCFAAEMNIQLTTNDGSTKMSVQNSGAAEVASVDSQGNATFNRVTQTGNGGSFIAKQNTLQSGATFYVSSGTVINLNTTNLKFADGTTLTTATGGGTITGVTAGYGISGGGISGNVTVNLVSNTTSYIQASSTLQSGATFYVSSGTVSGTLSAGTFSGSGANLTNLPATNLTGAIANSAIDSSSVTKQGNAFNGASQLVQLNGSGDLTALNAANLTSLTAGNLSGNVPIGNLGNAIQLTSSLQSGATFYVSSGTVSGTLTAGTFAGSGASLTNLPATSLTGTISNSAIDASSITKQGNTFNGASQLVQLNGSGDLTALNAANLTSLTAGNLSGNIPIGNLGNAIQLTSSLQSGATFYVSSGTVSGTLTAGTFAGSGASLTNLPAGQLIGTISNSAIDASSVTKQ